MKVLITGATGLIGKEIVALCHKAGMSVNYLTTNKQKIVTTPNYKGYYWDPKTGEIDITCIDEVEVIINLAGATVSKRWTKRYKQEIIESRQNALQLLYNTLQQQNHQIRQLITASAIGLYQDSFQNYYGEQSLKYDTSFLSDVVQKWEHNATQFKTLGIDVAVLRIGLVLSIDGGAFPQIVKPIKYGFGAILGTGKQWQSWIHIEDLSKMFLYVLEEELEGVFNAVAPNPVSNKKMTKTIAEYLGKDLWMPNVPKIGMKLLLGEMHELLFASQRVCSEKIEERGFTFKYENIQPAIEDLLT